MTGIRTTDLSRIYAGVPLNGSAASVTSNSRQHWEPKPNLGTRDHWENPPPCVPPEKYPDCPSFDDLRGRKMGRMTVVGYLGKSSKKQKARWLLRCSCGHYEAGKAAAILAVRNPDHCCENCNYQRRLREGYLS